MIQWIGGIVFTWLVLFGVTSANLGDAINESLVNDPGLSAVCGSSDKSWEKDKNWVFRCQDWSQAVNAVHLKNVYSAAHERI